MTINKKIQVIILIIIMIGLLIFAYSYFQNIKNQTLMKYNRRFTASQIINGERIDIDFEDFWDLKNNTKYEHFYIGDIFLPTGEITITDPIYLTHQYPLKRQVAKGQYPVYLFFTETNDTFGYRPIYAQIIFENNNPETFEYAIIDDIYLENPVERTINGMFPVDGGLISFSDYQTISKYSNLFSNYLKQNSDANFYTDILAKEFAKNGNIPTKSDENGDWLNFYLPNTNKENIIMFTSGLGDGLYPAYFGINNNKVVSLVIDFLTIKRINKITNH